MNTTYTTEEAAKLRQAWLDSLDKPKRKKTTTYKINSSGDNLWWVSIRNGRQRNERVLLKNLKSIAEARQAAETHAGEPLNWQDCDYYGATDYICCHGFATTTN